MYMYITGVAAMGAVVGMFVGLSNTPVVDILLPLLFTLLAGGSGAYVVLSGDGAKARLLGASLMAFAFTVAAAGLLAAMCRVSGCVFSAKDERTWIVEDLPVQPQIVLFQISSASQRLGISEQDRAALIRKVKSDVAKLPGELKTATAQLDKTVKALLISANETDAEPNAFHISLQKTSKRLNRLSAVLASNVAIPTNFVKELRQLSCVFPSIPQNQKPQDQFLAELNAYYVACATLIDIVGSHPSSILADLNNRLENIRSNWPENHQSRDKPALYFEDR